MAGPVTYTIEGTDAVLQFDKHPPIGARFDIQTDKQEFTAFEVIAVGKLKLLVTFKVLRRRADSVSNADALAALDTFEEGWGSDD